MKTFFPFEDVEPTDIDVLELLNLSKVRAALLWQLLRRLELRVWFNDYAEEGHPVIELQTYWDMNHVASMPLTELLEHLVAFHSDAPDIGRDEEIAALTDLKTLIEKAIASRQQMQP
jgi:hypothetical protein